MNDVVQQMAREIQASNFFDALVEEIILDEKVIDEALCQFQAELCYNDLLDAEIDDYVKSCCNNGELPRLAASRKRKPKSYVVDEIMYTLLVDLALADTIDQLTLK
eukprot:jgi/Hompol1/6042/HPOL_004814-RA